MEVREIVSCGGDLVVVHRARELHAHDSDVEVRSRTNVMCDPSEVIEHDRYEIGIARAQFPRGYGIWGVNHEP